MSKEEIKPSDIQLGNFVEVLGKTEIVMGITPREDGTFFIHHSCDNQDNNPVTNGIEFRAYPISLDETWKKALNIDKYLLPEWIKYVHEAQNYMKWYANVDLLPNVKWDIVPSKAN